MDKSGGKGLPPSKFPMTRVNLFMEGRNPLRPQDSFTPSAPHGANNAPKLAHEKRCKSRLTYSSIWSSLYS